MKVLRFIQKHNIKVKLKNVSENSDVRQEFSDLTGNTQVPCLIHGGEILYESDDIVQWLDKNGEKNDHA
jgi:glutathione S-transferase